MCVCVCVCVCVYFTVNDVITRTSINFKYFYPFLRIKCPYDAIF